MCTVLINVKVGEYIELVKTYNLEIHRTLHLKNYIKLPERIVLSGYKCTPGTVVQGVAKCDPLNC